MANLIVGPWHLSHRERTLLESITSYFNHELEQLVRVYGEDELEEALVRLVEERLMSPFTELKKKLVEMLSVHEQLEETWDYGVPWLAVVNHNQ
jgi:hypothetical protein